MLRCSGRCLCKTACNTTTTQSSFSSSTHYHSSGVFFVFFLLDSFQFPLLTLLFAPCMTAIPSSHWGYCNQMYLCTSCSETQSVLPPIRQKSHPWKEHTFQPAARWAERANHTPFNKGATLSGRDGPLWTSELWIQKSVLFPCLKHQPLNRIYDMVSLNFIKTIEKSH